MLLVTVTVAVVNILDILVSVTSLVDVVVRVKVDVRVSVHVLLSSVPINNNRIIIRDHFMIHLLTIGVDMKQAVVCVVSISNG